MKDRYKSLLDKIYEIEGLLLLGLNREKVPEGLDALIVEKWNRLSNEIELAETHPQVQETPVNAEPSLTVPLEESPIIPPIEAEKENETENKVGEDGSSEQHLTSEKTILKKSEKDSVSEIAREINTQVSTQIDESVGPFYALEDDDEEIVAVPPKKAGVKRYDRKKPIFSLNDKFLFIRELFGGDASAFKAAVDKISFFKDFDEAEQYFLDDLQMDPENDTVDRFLEAISECF